MTTATIASPPPGIESSQRWTIAEFDRMVAVGLLPEGSRAFLWNGEILHPMTENRPHVNAFIALGRFFFNRLDEADWTILAGNPLILREGYKPQPDYAVLRGPHLGYLDRDPIAADAALVVEISDSSRPFDAGEKLREYAAAGIDQYWIVDINARLVEVRRGPRREGEDGVYGDLARFGIDEEVPLALSASPGEPDRIYPPIAVRDILRGSLKVGE